MTSDAGGPGNSDVQARPDAAERSENGSAAVPVRREVRLSRAPKYSAFLGTGALAGVVLGVILIVLAGNRAAEFSLATRLGYLCTVLALLGALIGGTVAVLVDRSRR